jgi:hypothetical protein
MIFKCNFAKLPLPSGEAIEAAIASELPAYVHYLLNEHKIRGDLRDDRFGIKAYHHPVVLEALSATTPQTQLLQEIDRLSHSIRNTRESGFGRAVPPSFRKSSNQRLNLGRTRQERVSPPYLNTATRAVHTLAD